MIGYIVTIILFLAGLFIHRRRKTWVAPDVLFCYQWALISFLASLHLFGMYEASGLAWLIILIGTLSYITGVRMSIPLKEVVQRRPSVDVFFFNKNTFWFFFIILFIFCWQDFMESLRFQLAGNSLQEMRGANFGSADVVGFSRRTGGLFEILYTLQGALKLVVIAVGIHYFTVGERKRFLYLMSAVSLVTMEAFTNGGRFGLAYLLVEILVCFFFYKRRATPVAPRKTASKFQIYFIVGAVLFIMVAVSFTRGWEVGDFTIKYYRYICGNIVFFDKHLSTISDNSPYYLIWCSFYGFWALLFPFIRAVLGFSYPDSYNDASRNIIAPIQDPMEIGNNMITNAFITPFYHLYADARFFGVVVGMFLFGLFCGFVYKKACYYTNGRNVIFYLIVSQMIFKTISAYPFAVTGYVFIILFFFIYRKKSFNVFK